MRKVKPKMNEQFKFEIIKNVVKARSTKILCGSLGITRRSVNCLLEK